MTEQTEWFTEEFVTAIFGADVSKKECSVELAISGGENFLSDIYRITNGRRSYIVKVKPAGAIKEVVENLVAFEKELSMYDFLDEIEEVLGQRLFPERIVYKDLIVLEDLKVTGYKVEDRRMQLNLEHSRAAIQCIAKFHAASYIILSQPLKRKTYKLLTKEVYFCSSNTKIFSMILPVMKQVIHEIQNWPEIVHLHRKLDKYIESFFNLCTSEVLVGHNCGFMNHGDFHTGNIMFNDCLDIKLIDFQFSRENKPALDIITFMLTSIKPEVRALYMDHLLEEYCDSFNSIISSCKISLRVTVQDLKTDIDDLKHFTFYIGILRTALVLSETSEKFKESSLNAKNISNIYRNETYKQILSNLIKQLNEEGLFDL